MDRTQSLLETGYFPSQLPPSFTTRDLATDHAKFYAAWLALPTKGSSVAKAPLSKAELFSVARVEHKRRITSLPNPVAQTYLATRLVSHWGAFIAHYRKSRLSASRPTFRPGKRAAGIPSMQHLYDRKIAKSAGYRFMLRTDVSRFFPTIYTHTVPWAMHGKSVAKQHKQQIPKYFGNLLDLDLRQGQEGQTIGIPIGPSTSHMIAEAIATSVDLELKKRLHGWPAGFRYVDDYYLFFATAKEADQALAAIVRSLKEFELQINFEKTAICPVIEISNEFWTHQLRNFSIARAGRRQASDINHFFELAKNLASSNHDESVMVYALKRISSAIVRKDHWKIFEAHLCNVALAYSNTLQTIARILSTYGHLGYALDKDRLSRLVNAIIEDHAPLAHHSEVSWCLWMCKDLGLTLDDSNVDRVSEMHSSVCALLLLDLYQLGVLGKLPDLAYWQNFANAEGLDGDLWLLSYEAGLRKWGGFSDTHLQAHPHFNVLRAAMVHFYDETATLPPLFHVKPEALALHSVVSASAFFDLENIDDLDELVEHEEDDSGYEGVVIPDDEEEAVADVDPQPVDEDEHGSAPASNDKP